MEDWLKIKDIIGLTVEAIRGNKPRKNAKYVDPEVILFSDGETYIKLEDQDSYSYHDCSSSAKELEVRRSEDLWNMYMGDEYMDSTIDI